MTQQLASAQPNDLTVCAIPAFNDNYIWLLEDNHSQQHWLVDPGDGQAVLDYLKQRQITDLAGVLITHHHNDHIGGLDTLTSQFPELAIYGVKSDRVMQVNHTVTSGDKLQLSANLALQVLSVPGHTRDHIVYYRDHPTNPLLFSGDTLFAGGCGRLFEGTPQQMRQSLAQLRQLSAQTSVYCAHEYTSANLAFAQVVEPFNEALQRRASQVAELRAQNIATVPSKLQQEIATNPFLRWDQPAVIQAATVRGADNNNPDDVFAKIRAWKDEF